ncbi:MAG: transglutaminase domain-containing protein [Deltaproteobacteria bacterium]|nr:transglutaminase domain-containing protein [Deltaproteobacteria bacterium]
MKSYYKSVLAVIVISTLSCCKNSEDSKPKNDIKPLVEKKSDSGKKPDKVIPAPPTDKVVPGVWLDEKISDIVSSFENLKGESWYGLYMFNNKVGYSVNNWKMEKSPKGPVFINTQKFHMEIVNMGDKKVVEILAVLKFEGYGKGATISQENLQTTNTESRRYVLKLNDDGKYSFSVGTGKPGEKSFKMSKPIIISEKIGGLSESELALAYKISRGKKYWKNQTVWKSRKFNYSTGGISVETVSILNSDKIMVGGLKKVVYNIMVNTDKPKMQLKTVVDSDGSMVSGNFGPMILKREEKNIAVKLDASLDIGIMAMIKVYYKDFNPKKTDILKIALSGPFPDVSGYNNLRYSYKKTGKTGELTLKRDSLKGLAKVDKSKIKDPEILKFTKPDHNIESNDPVIIALADKIRKKHSDPIDQIRATVSFVSEYVTDTMKADFDSAVMVAKEKRGDCTEHTLLTTAILRALGFPARSVGGVGYVNLGPKNSGLGYHAWVQVWVSRWIDIDPTWNQFPADVSHILLGTPTDLTWISAIGSLKIEKILEMK